MTPGWPPQPGQPYGTPPTVPPYFYQQKPESKVLVVLVLVGIGLVFVLMPLIALMFLSGSIASILSSIGQSLGTPAP